MSKISSRVHAQSSNPETIRIASFSNEKFGTRTNPGLIQQSAPQVGLSDVEINNEQIELHHHVADLVNAGSNLGCEMAVDLKKRALEIGLVEITAYATFTVETPSDYTSKLNNTKVTHHERDANRKKIARVEALVNGNRHLNLLVPDDERIRRELKSLTENLRKIRVWDDALQTCSLFINLKSRDMALSTEHERLKQKLEISDKKAVESENLICHLKEKVAQLSQTVKPSKSRQQYIPNLFNRLIGIFK